MKNLTVLRIHFLHQRNIKVKFYHKSFLLTSHEGFVGGGRRGGVVRFDSTLGFPGEGPDVLEKKKCDADASKENFGSRAEGDFSGNPENFAKTWDFFLPSKTFHKLAGRYDGQGGVGRY